MSTSTEREITADVVVVGSGAAGLAVAVTAAHAGRRVLVGEAASPLGGATRSRAGCRGSR
jgi:phytoene dehydrogenase-like protein